MQGNNLTELPFMVRDKHPEPGVNTQVETATGGSEESQETRVSHTAASQTDSWQLAPGERQVWLGRVSRRVTV